MTFDDLPRDWPLRSLADPVLAADVLDLFVSERDRDVGGFAVLRCGPRGRLVQPTMIAGGSAMAEEREDDPALRHAIRSCRDGADRLEPADSLDARVGEVGTLVLGIVRPGGPLVDAERDWHQRAINRCHDTGVRLWSVHLITHAGVRVLPGPMAPPPPASWRPSDIES